MALNYPYVFLGSAPIGPIALNSLRLAHAEPDLVIDDPTLSSQELIALIESVQPTFLLVVGFGAILSRDVLDTVAGQVLNIHPSLLPAYRGPAPVVQTILDGVTETGVTLMEIDPGMDSGPIVAQATQRLSGKELPNDLYQSLTHKGVELFLEYIDRYITDDELLLTPQNGSEATITRFIKKEDGEIDPSKPAERLEREVRAYAGWPGSWLIWRGKRIIVEKAHVQDGRLVIDQVKPEGGRSMSVEALAAGQRIKPAVFYQEIGL